MCQPYTGVGLVRREVCVRACAEVAILLLVVSYCCIFIGSPRPLILTLYSPIFPRVPLLSLLQWIGGFLTFFLPNFAPLRCVRFQSSLPRPVTPMITIPVPAGQCHRVEWC